MIRSIACASLVLSGIWLSGCAASRASLLAKQNRSGYARTTATYHTMPRPSWMRGRDAAGFGQTAPNSVQRAASIGIFGEPITRTMTSAGFGDGAANLTQVTFAREGADFDPDVDPTGRWIVFSSTQHRQTADIYKKPADGSTITQLTSDPADDIMPDFSPDGRWIAFASNRSGNFDIYIMPVTGGRPRVITDDPGEELHPSWSADGKHLVYCRYGEQSGRWEMWVTQVDHTAVRSFIDYGFLPEWSPDPAQNKIVFQRARERGSRYHSIWTIDYINGQGRNPTEIVSASNAALINPAWSPDGSHIVFATVIEPEAARTERPGESDLWIVGLDGSNRRNLAAGAAANLQPTWGGDGRVYFVSDRGGQDNLWSVAASSLIDPRRRGGSRDAVATAPEPQ